ncbi:YkgJ family cysteine cluster protein [Malonomonas rubra]|uniref:YkgJ family cysteine cluster protein n=1 Tax=Malonomonas rubra TaxID=57040 RepID=UPI0026EDCE7C|nr:YkgJ family cysteine cluster protein [Malonomonas rubra]
MESFDLLQYQQRVGESIVEVCREQTSFDPVQVQLRFWAEDAEKLLKQHPGDRSQIACGPGCCSCCVINVAILLPEGFAIVRYLKQQEREHVAERLEDLWRQVRGLDDDERLFVQRSCAFLDEDGNCSVYPVRPLLCRSVTSTCSNSCREALNSKFLGEEKAVLMHQFQQGLYEGLFSGVAAGLEISGLDGRSYPLAGLVRYLLQDSEFETAWLEGHRLTWKDIY